MSFTLRKGQTAYPPHPTQDIAGAGFMTGGLVKVGSVITANTGIWRGAGALNPKFQWYFGTSSVANATNASFSVQSAGSGLTVRMSVGNATWGTYWRDVVAAGTVLP